MNILQPWQLLLIALAGWISRQQQDVIEYLQEENRVLKSKLKGMIFFGEDSMRRTISEFMIYYHGERNHQGLGNRLIDPQDEAGSLEGLLACRERLGGVLRYYHRKAA